MVSDDATGGETIHVIAAARTQVRVGSAMTPAVVRVAAARKAPDVPIKAGDSSKVAATKTAATIAAGTSTVVAATSRQPAPTKAASIKARAAISLLGLTRVSRAMTLATA